MAKENKEKRRLKGEPRIGVNLSEEQKKAKTDFYNYDVNFILGDYASGKTLCSCAIAITAFRKKQYNKIVITRPIVKNNLGYLPGDISEKLQPWVAPIVHNFNMIQASTSTEKMMKDKAIEILPIDFAKGITYVDSVVIVDEAQDMSYDDFRTMLTRLGRDSKIIFLASEQQVDKSMTKASCIKEIVKLENSDLVGFNRFVSNHRNEVLPKILNFLENKNK